MFVFMDKFRAQQLFQNVFVDTAGHRAFKGAPSGFTDADGWLLGQLQSLTRNARSLMRCEAACRPAVEHRKLRHGFQVRGNLASVDVLDVPVCSLRHSLLINWVQISK